MADRSSEEKRPDSSSGVDSASPKEVEAGQNAPTLADKEALTTVTSPSDDQTPYLQGIKLFFVMASVTLVILLAMLDISILSTAIPQITSDFHRLGDVGWYIGAYQLASATVQPLTGKLFTYFNTKWTFLIFFLIFEVGSAVCGAATSSAMLIGGRSVAGVGASGLVNGGLTIILGACEPSVRPLYTGMAMGVGQLGIILGPLLGGIFTEHVSWRWCFYINLPFGGVAGLFMILVSVPEQMAKQPPSLAYIRSLIPHFDLTGFALFAPASIMFLLALQFGAGEYGWNSSEVIGLFCGAGVTAIIFGLWERRMGDEAMIPFPMVRQKIMWSSSLSYALLMSSIVVGSNFVPIFLQSVKGLSPTMSGVYMLATIIPQLILVIVSGALVTKFGYYLPWIVGSAACTAIGAGLISTWQPSTSLGKLLGYQILFGSRGAGMQMGVIAIQHHLPAKMVAIGNSFLVFSQNFAGAIFITIANTIFQESLKSTINSNVPGISPDAAVAAGGSAGAVRALAPPGPLRDALFGAYSDGFTHVFYLVISTCCVAFFVSFGMGWVDLRVKKEHKKATTPQQEEANTE